MKFLKLFLLTLLLSSNSFAQLDVKFLIVPGLSNQAQIWSYVNLSNGNKLIATNQNVAGVVKSFLIETDSFGNYISAKSFQSVISEIKLCSDNGYILMFGDFTMMKTDSSFNIVWTKKMINVSSSYAYIGGQMIAELNGYYYVLAAREDSVFNPGVGILSTFDNVLFKFDSLGNLIKHKIITDTLHMSYSYNRFIRSFTAGKNCLYAGVSLLAWADGGTCRSRPAVMKIDTSLSVSWTNNYQANAFQELAGVRNFLGDDLFVYGIRSYNYPTCTQYIPYLVKADSTGNVLFTRDYFLSYTTECSFNDLAINPDSSATLSLEYIDTASGKSKFLLARVNPYGQLINSTEINSAYQSGHAELKILNHSNALINVCQVYNSDTILLFTEDTSFSGNCLNVPVLLFDSASTSWPGTINNNYFLYNFSFADTSMLPVQTSSVTSIMLCTTLGENLIAEREYIKIFPNPSSGDISISSDKNILELIITDLTGRVIYRAGPKAKATTLTIRESGIYVIRLTTATSTIVRKIEVVEK